MATQKAEAGKKEQIIGGVVLFVIIAIFFKACGGGPNLEVSLETGTTNLQQELGMGGLIDWGQAGRIDYEKQVVKIVSLEDDGVDIYKVEINKGNCGGYDSYKLDKESAEKAIKQFNESLPQIGDIFFAPDEQYFNANREIFEKAEIEKNVRHQMCNNYSGYISSHHYGVGEKQWEDIRSLICSKADRVVEYAVRLKDKSFDDTIKALKTFFDDNLTQEIENEIVPILSIKTKEREEWKKNQITLSHIFSGDRIKSLQDKGINITPEQYTAMKMFLPYINNSGLNDGEFVNSLLHDVDFWKTKENEALTLDSVTAFILALPTGELISNLSNKDKDERKYSPKQSQKFIQTYENEKEKGVKFKEVSDKQYIGQFLDKILERGKNITINTPPMPKAYEVVSLPEPPPYTDKHKIHLDYGKSRSFRIYEPKCKVKEVKIETDKGEATYSF